MTTRRKFSSAFKLKVACEALLQQRTIAEISSKYSVNATQINHWKKQLKDHGPEIFDSNHSGGAKKNAALIEELYRQIGQQKVECDWLKKKSEQLLS
jgi:transposase